MRKNEERENHYHQRQDNADEISEDNCHASSIPHVDIKSGSITGTNAATTSSASAAYNGGLSNQIQPDATCGLSDGDNLDVDVGSNQVEFFASSPLSFRSDDRYPAVNVKDPDLPPILTPPRQLEQSAREQLIDRERQARMERERARLMRRFTLTRETDEEEKKSVMNNDDFKLMSDFKNEHEKSGEDDEDFKSLACTAGEESDEEHCVSGANVESSSCNANCVKDDNSATKLGFTMERFLKNSLGVEDVENHLNVQAALDPLNLPDANTSEHEEEEGEEEEEEEEEEVGSVVSMEVRMCNSDLSVSCRIDNEEITNERNSDPNVEEGTASHHIPRLAQLTEARILVDMAEIDYASVGNMPPRSVRDEQQLPDLSGMSNASFDLTHTTAQESDASICAPSVRTRASSVENIHNQVIGNVMVSPGSNVVDQLPVENAASSASCNSAESNPIGILNGGNSLHNYGNLDAFLLEGDHEHLSSLPRSSPVSTMPFDECNVRKENNIIKNASPRQCEDPERYTLRPERCNAPLVPEDSDQTQLDGSSDHTYQFPNRLVRPGMIQLGNDARVLKGHRRAQTTPNIPSFIDDFDYCKYNSHEQTPNQSQIFGGAFDDVFSRKTSPRWNISHRRDSYMAIDPEENAPLLNVCVQNEEEKDPNGVFALDSMIESVFSSLRSMSTADFQAELNDCDRYSSSHIVKRGETHINKLHYLIQIFHFGN